MDENKNNPDKIDELLESTSSENRIKFNFAEIESIKGPEIEEIISDTPDKKASPKAEPLPVIKAEPIDEPKPSKQPVQTEQQQFSIIDETSTTVTFEEGPDISIDEISPSKKSKVKKPKEKIKFSVLQIVLISVAAVITLWFVFFTVDHTLAAQGISPIFCRETAVYEDNSASYKGLGYKIQFKFDSKGNLTQKCLPAWKDGPNDLAHGEN